MGDVKGFMKYDRQNFSKEDPNQRIHHYHEFTKLLNEDDIRNQGARCMDCGIPFCQSGCPIGNIIPDWNDLVFRGQWQDAINRLHKTNNFPEFTGRVCPAPCENSCTLAINKEPVTIKNIEVSIVERAFQEGWIKPTPPQKRTGKKIAVIGSGPAGLSCADQLNKAGHLVTVYEKNEVIGGLLTLGIPDFKMEKSIIERRVEVMRQEGITFLTKINVGKDVSANELKKQFDAIVLCGGAEQPRDLNVPGRELNGVHFAMEFLTQQNRRNRNLSFSDQPITAKGKNVVILGGGDTGSDCLGTSHRQQAKSVKQFELMPEPPKQRTPTNPWPQWAFTKKISTSHEEGVEQEFCVLTKKLTGENGQVRKLHAVRLEFGPKDPMTGRSEMKEIPNSEFEIEADLVLLAMGFLGPVKNGLLEELGVELNQRGNVIADDNKMTNIPGVFTAGDMCRGQSLVVWAIQEGRAAARGVDIYLMGDSQLLAMPDQAVSVPF